MALSNALQAYNKEEFNDGAYQCSRLSAGAGRTSFYGLRKRKGSTLPTLDGTRLHRDHSKLKTREPKTGTLDPFGYFPSLWTLAHKRWKGTISLKISPPAPEMRLENLEDYVLPPMIADLR
jgi:hypothetical protein